MAHTRGTGCNIQKIFIILTAVKTSQKVTFLESTQYHSIGRLSKKVSTKQQLINDSMVTDRYKCGVPLQEAFIHVRSVGYPRIEL
jgi:hypothetical protein